MGLFKVGQLYSRKDIYYMMDKSVLQEEPFKSLGSIAEVFQLEDAMKVVQVIDGINKNAVEVVGA